MFSHVMVGSNDLERSKQFYDGLFGKARAAGRQGPAELWPQGRGVHGVPADRRPAGDDRQRHRPSDFRFDTPEEVDAWHAAESPQAAPRSRIRPACAATPSARSTSLICAIPTAINCARCTVPAQ